MSTRTDWGYFRRVTRLEPVAVAHEHHKWQCPNRKWLPGETYVHPYTGEECQDEPRLDTCPMRSAGPKRDECTRCDVVFIYP